MKGWGRDHFDYVINAETICEGTSDLISFMTFSDLALQFAQSLAHHNRNIVKASWFLEYSRSRFDAYTPPDTDEMTALLTDKNLLRQAYEVVCDKAMNNSRSPTYWRDTFNTLGL